MRKMSHQEQIRKQNESKRKVVHAQAHARATTFVAKERALPIPPSSRTQTARSMVEVGGGGGV